VPPSRLLFSVEGNILTLKVEFHSKAFVYPVISGQGWETSYTIPVIVHGPEDETQIRERQEREAREQKEREAAEAGGTEPPEPPLPSTPITQAEANRLVQAKMQQGGGVAAPPESSCHGTCAGASSVVNAFLVDEIHECQIDHCSEWRVNLEPGDVHERPEFERGYNWAEWVNHTPYGCSDTYSTALALLTGLSVTEEGCGLLNPPWKVWKGEDRHLTLWGRWRIEEPFVTDLYQGFETNFLALQIHIWPNGFQEPIVKHYPPSVVES
jgi:hypothetical protein